MMPAHIDFIGCKYYNILYCKRERLKIYAYGNFRRVVTIVNTEQNNALTKYTAPESMGPSSYNTW